LKTVIAFGLFAASIYCANLLTSHYGIVSAPLYSVTAGTFMAGLTFSLRDALRETSGRTMALVAIVIGALMSYEFGGSEKIAIASGLAFLFSESADALVYEPLRRRWWLAVTASNAVGMVVDSMLFLWLAFGSIQFWEGQVFYKAVMTLLAIVAIGGFRVVSQRGHHSYA